MYGTSAGMIMFAKQIVVNQAGVETLGLIDIDVIRTGYGRQVHSTEKQITVDLGNGLQTLKATFIRAPVVTRVGEKVRVIVQDGNTPLLVSEGRILAGSFHTELDDDTTLLEYFIREFVAGR
jgi:5'-phosphate synthase pdxT subunit